MSEKPSPPGPCGKRRYRDRLAALIALAEVVFVDAPGRPKHEVRAYRCPACRGWHLTSWPTEPGRSAT